MDIVTFTLDNDMIPLPRNSPLAVESHGNVLRADDLNKENVFIEIKHNGSENSKSIRRTSDTTNNLETISKTQRQR
jgi:hypothetical protein